MENLTETHQSTQKSQRKVVTVLGVSVIVLVLAVLGLMTAYYFQMQRRDDLQRQVDDLKTAAAKMDEEMAKNTDMSSNVQYREIPELGVKYKLTDQVKDLTYSYSSFIVKGGDEGRRVGFSTIAISAQEGSQGDYPCKSAAAPSGSIVRYKNGDIQIAGAFVKNIGKKIGDYYYVYEHPQYMCSLTSNSNATVVTGLQESIDALKAAYDSLEAM